MSPKDSTVDLDGLGFQILASEFGQGSNLPEVFGGTSLWKYLMEIVICLKRQFGCKTTSNLDSPACCPSLSSGPVALAVMLYQMP